MNYYLRYFDSETLVHTIDEAIDFLCTIDEIDVTPAMENELREYAQSDILFPKRYKVRPRVYFIVIKTEAANMRDFKDKKALRKDPDNGPGNVLTQKQLDIQRLNTKRYGWYEGELEFKRVVPNSFGKCEYKDTQFTVRCIAESPMDCYNRIVAYLMQHVDRRSQFPSARGRNFVYSFLGTVKNAE